MQVREYNFRYICDIKPLRDEKCEIEKFSPQVEYKNLQGLSLNKYGHGPFCKFIIPSDIQQEGVYAIKVNDEIVYVGICENLSQRFNIGYGSISPRNCFVGGQSTNCRINNNIYVASQSSQEIKLYFLKTNNKFSIETYLIASINPIWNISRGTNRNPVRESKKLSETETKKLRLKSNCRNELLSAVNFIVQHKGKNEFTVNEVIEYMNELNTIYKESTIRTHITSKCCVNAPSNHATVYNDFRRIRIGVYELYNFSQ